MSATISARDVLRSATAEHHDRVDRLFSRADLSERDGYGRFLTAQAAAHIAAETALTTAGAASVMDDWPERRREAMVRDDLATLGLQCPDPFPVAPFDGEAAILGGIYVLEGSRLGGRLLSRSVASDLPRRFLSAGDSAAWRRLLALLDTRLVDDADQQIAVEAARAVFMLFEHSGEQHLHRRHLERL